MKPIFKPFPQMPLGLQEVMGLFQQEQIHFVLFKAEHIVEGQNKNLDILCQSEDDYRRASLILQQHGFVLYLPETVEQFKQMWARFDQSLVTAVHLHREVAWHGLRVLDKSKLFERVRGGEISPEDALTIHIAHALFENFKIKANQLRYLEEYRHQAHDFEYIDAQLNAFGWRAAFYSVLALLDKSTGKSIESEDRKGSTAISIPTQLIISAYGGLFKTHPSGMFTLFQKGYQRIRRQISLRRSGSLIVLTGINGAGKSTVREVLGEAYAPLTQFTRGQGSYYFGWRTSWLTPLVTWLRQKQGKEKLFTQVSQGPSDEMEMKFSLFQELMLLYIYGSLQWKYWTKVYPSLRQGKLVICDRYFYDLYGLYPYSSKSVLLSVLPFSKPDHAVLLDINVDAALARGKKTDVGPEGIRQALPRETLEGQRRRYFSLTSTQGMIILNGTASLSTITSVIIGSSWKLYLEKLNKSTASIKQ